jgi:hypothetical protein
MRKWTVLTPSMWGEAMISGTVFSGPVFWLGFWHASLGWLWLLLFGKLTQGFDDALDGG